jgi:ferredoxin
MSEEAPKKRERPPSAYRIDIIRRRCTGVGTCMDLAPRTFDIDDDSVAIIRKPNGDVDEKILAAAQGCPQDAIVLYDVATGEKIWPPGKVG